MPLRLNDGQEVQADLFDLTRRELVAQFGAMSFYPQSLLGIWTHEGGRFEDELVRLAVDVEDTPENRQFFAGFKRVLLERFEQIEIYLASYPIDVI